MWLICSCRKTRLILDLQGRIIATLVGHPDDPEWGRVADDAAAVLCEVQRVGSGLDVFPLKSANHRRGRFLAIPVGVSFGGGQTVRGMLQGNFFNEFRFREIFLTHFKLQEPGNLVHTKEVRRLIRKILDSHSIRRIAGFQSS